MVETLESWPRSRRRWHLPGIHAVLDSRSAIARSFDPPFVPAGRIMPGQMAIRLPALYATTIPSFLQRARIDEKKARLNPPKYHDEFTGSLQGRASIQIRRSY